MIPAVARFVEALRREGVVVSPAELIDAASAIEAVGIEDRRRFRAALSATLAKERRDQETFARVFDRFFAPPSRTGGKGRAGERGGDPEQRGSGEGAGGTRRREKPVERRGPAREPGGRATDRPGERGLAARVREKTLRRILAEARESGSRPGARLRRVRARRDAGASTHDALDLDLSAPLATEEELRLAREVPRLVQELRLRSGRRLRRSKRGEIWTRRIFRENLARGGTPFVLPRRRRRPSHSRVVVLVDVSASVSRAAGYFLTMALEFLRPGPRTRVLVFVDRAVDATVALARWGRTRAEPKVPSAGTARPRRGRRGKRAAEGIARGGLSFADLLDSLPGLDPEGASDYGRAFHSVLASHHRPSGRKTVLVVLGDGRTNRFDPLPWAFEEIASRCGAVLWLVPEPRSRWGTGDSALGSYLGSVDVVVESNDLRGLTGGLAELLRRL